MASGSPSAAAKKEAAENREVFRKVVNIASVAAGGMPGMVGYSVGKAGILGLTRTLAKEWGLLKVNVNAVAFGAIDTRLIRATAEDSCTTSVGGHNIHIGASQKFLDRSLASTPLGRKGTPEEAAGAVYLLCIAVSDYVSRQTLVCGGGPWEI